MCHKDRALITRNIYLIGDFSTGEGWRRGGGGGGEGGGGGGGVVGGAVDERYVTLGGGVPSSVTKRYKGVGGCQVFRKKALRNT